jgi:hypothetical protein
MSLTTLQNDASQTAYPQNTLFMPCRSVKVPANVDARTVLDIELISFIMIPQKIAIWSTLLEPDDKFGICGRGFQHGDRVCSLSGQEIRLPESSRAQRTLPAGDRFSSSPKIETVPGPVVEVIRYSCYSFESSRNGSE